LKIARETLTKTKKGLDLQIVPLLYQPSTASSSAEMDTFSFTPSAPFLYLNHLLSPSRSSVSLPTRSIRLSSHYRLVTRLPHDSCQSPPFQRDCGSLSHFCHPSSFLSLWWRGEMGKHFHWQTPFFHLVSPCCHPCLQLWTRRHGRTLRYCTHTPGHRQRCLKEGAEH